MRVRLTHIGLDLGAGQVFPEGKVFHADEIPAEILQARFEAGTAEIVGDLASAAADFREIAQLAIAGWEQLAANLRAALNEPDQRLAAAFRDVGEAADRDFSPSFRALVDAGRELEAAIELDAEIASVIDDQVNDNQGEAEASASAAQTQDGDAGLQDASGGGSPAAGADNNPPEDGAAGNAGEASANSAEPAAPATAPVEPAAAGTGEVNAEPKPKPKAKSKA